MNAIDRAMNAIEQICADRDWIKEDYIVIRRELERVAGVARWEVIHGTPLPKPPEFRKGDLIRVELPHKSQTEYLLVISPHADLPNYIQAQDGNYATYILDPKLATLVERSSTPTGPIRVGSYVKHTRCEHWGVVNLVRTDKLRPFRVRWEDGVYTFHAKDELIHIASPDNHEQ